MKHEFTVVFERGDNGWWIATALEIQGGFSQGETLEEARENVIDAMRRKRNLSKSELVDGTKTSP